VGVTVKSKIFAFANIFVQNRIKNIYSFPISTKKFTFVFKFIRHSFIRILDTFIGYTSRGSYKARFFTDYDEDVYFFISQILWEMGKRGRRRSVGLLQRSILHREANPIANLNATGVHTLTSFSSDVPRDLSQEKFACVTFISLLRPRAKHLYIHLYVSGFAFYTET